MLVLDFLLAESMHTPSTHMHIDNTVFAQYKPHSLYINRQRENFTFSASCAFHSVFTKLYSQCLPSATQQVSGSLFFNVSKEKKATGKFVTYFASAYFVEKFHIVSGYCASDCECVCE